MGHAMRADKELSVSHQATFYRIFVGQSPSKARNPIYIVLFEDVSIAGGGGH